MEKKMTKMEENVLDIQMLTKMGVSADDIASDLGVSIGLVRTIQSQMKRDSVNESGVSNNPQLLEE